MSLKLKLLGGIVLIVLTSFACIGFGLISSKDIFRSVYIIEKVTFPSLNKADVLTQAVKSTNEAIIAAIDGDEDFEKDVNISKQKFLRTVTFVMNTFPDQRLREIEKEYLNYVSEGIKFGNKVLKDSNAISDDLQIVSGMSLKINKKIENFQSEKLKEFRSALNRIVINSENFSQLFYISGIFLFFAVFILSFITIFLIRTITSLQNHAFKLSEGDLSEEIVIDREDELGTLQQAFENMRESLKDHIENLDQKVKKRTQDLLASQKETKDILNSIGQGIFTFNLDLTINKEHSAEAEQLFETKEFQNLSLQDVLSMDEKEKQTFVQWLKLIQKEKFLNKWSKYEKLNPIKERYIFKNEKKKILKIDYQPIFEDHQLKHIMVLASDITRQKLVEEALEKVRQDQQAQMQRVTGLVNHSFSEIQLFLEDLENLKERCQKIKEQQDLKFQLKEIFREVHTAKGNSGMYGFEILENCLNHLEDILSDLQIDAEKDLKDAWKERLSDLEEELNKIEKLNKLLFSEAKGSISIREDQYLDLLNSLQSEKLQNSKEIHYKLLMMESFPFSKYCKKFQNIVEQTRVKLSKNIKDLHIIGGEHEIHRKVMERVEDSLCHLIRNAVDHGIDHEGVVSLEFRKEKHTYHFIVSDDGKGIDVDKVFKKAIDKGFLTGKENLSREEKMNLIFLAGFSSKSKVGYFSGRGMGMDIVKEIIEEELKGKVKLESENGKGSSITLQIPVKE